ncbi:MAG: M23 family metallopeptidase [Elainellaceae cyanobacterium]
MSHSLKTGGLLTTALLAWTTLDVVVPGQAHAESDVDAASVSQELPVIPVTVPQSLLPVPSPLPPLQIPGRDYIPFQPVDEVVPDVAPSPIVLPPAGAIAGVEIEVIPFAQGDDANPREGSEWFSVHDVAPEYISAESGSEFSISETRVSQSSINESGINDSSISGPISIPAVERIVSIEEVWPQPEDGHLDMHLDEPHDGTQSTDEAFNNALNPETSPQPLAEQTTAAASEGDAKGESSAQKSELLAAAQVAPPAEPRGWFDRQLAATIARQKAHREARLRENLINAVRQHVAQNNIAAAQRIAQNPVFLDAERTALQQAIAARQPMPQVSSPTQTEPTTELAKDVARLAARQTWLLERLPAMADSNCEQNTTSRAIAPPACSSNQTDSQDNSQTNFNYGWLVQAANRATPSLSASVSGPLAIAAPVTSRYGWRIHPIYGDHRFHAGVDFGAPLGTPVHASLSGYVETSEYLDGYGFTVILESASAQERHLYAHLADLGVHTGQWVEQGQVIGWVGNTGNSTGPHLHYEVHRLAQNGWITVDPLSVAAQEGANL